MSYVQDNTITNTLSTYSEVFEDFGGLSGAFFAHTFNGSNNFNGIVTAQEFGILESGTAVSATGRSGIRWEAGSILFGGGTNLTEVKVRLPLLSDAVDTYTVYSGYNDVSGGDAVDGAYFRYTNAVNTGKWQAVTRSNSVETAVDTGVTVPVNAWQKLRVVVNGAGTQADFFIDGVLTNSITTNIPVGVGRTTGLNTNILKSLGTNARVLQIDYCLLRANFTTAR